MRRVAIVGSAGAGKSTLARQLGAILGLEVVHLDALFWKPGWVETPRPEWRVTQEGLVRRESWIIDGNYGGTMEVRLASADTIVFLDFPRAICLWRVLKRWARYRGHTRPDLAPGCPERLDWAFLRWVWGYRVRSRPSVLKRIEEHSAGKSVYTLRSPTEVSDFLKQVASIGSATG